MSIRANMQLRKAKVRSKGANLKSRVGSRARGSMFGNKLSGMKYRLSRIRTRQRMG